LRQRAQVHRPSVSLLKTYRPALQTHIEADSSAQTEIETLIGAAMRCPLERSGNRESDANAPDPGFNACVPEPMYEESTGHWGTLVERKSEVRLERVKREKLLYES
jgi:hypothetical protein